jgi:hypothetical protein
MKRIQTRTAARGQAFTEMVIWLFVLLLMISGIIWFGKATNLKLHCHAAARYTAWAHAVSHETELEDDAIMSRAQAYFPLQDEFDGQWTRLDPSTASSSDADTDTSGPSGNGLDIFSILNGLFGQVSNTHGWMVQASYAPGGILDSTLPDGTAVRSQHFVSGGPWDKKQTRGDLIITATKTALMAWSVAVLN